MGELLDDEPFDAAALDAEATAQADALQKNSGLQLQIIYPNGKTRATNMTDAFLNAMDTALEGTYGHINLQVLCSPSYYPTPLPAPLRHECLERYLRRMEALDKFSGGGPLGSNT